MKYLLAFVVGFGFLSGLSLWAAAPKSTPALLAKGKAAYSTTCVTCHGDKGDGNGPAGAVMNPKPRHFAKDKFKKGDKLEDIFATVSNGLEGTAMTGFAYLPEDDRWGLAYYVQSLRKQKAGKKK